ncbi:MAG: hypothetical protein MUC98_00440 [Desulfobacterota bacterium]|jgi:hypothetical protein|nr:hypothetical protein [Thermodesulfobacteriota bacterium]
MKRALEKSVFSYLNKKTVLLRQYLSVTAGFVDALKEGRSREAEPFLFRRQTLIQGIDALDRSFGACGGPLSPGPADLSGAPPEAVRESLDDMRRVLSEAQSKDKELNVLAKKESESLRSELLKLRVSRSAAQGYAAEDGPGPRFLDTRK